MIYFKKKSLIKKAINNAKKKAEDFKLPAFSFSRNILFSLLLLLIILYSSYLFLLPKYLDEAAVEKAINNFVLKNSKLSLDIAGLKISPNYKFDVNLKADLIELNYPNKEKFIVTNKLNIDINLLSLLYKNIDLNKIQIEKAQINTNFTKEKKYTCFKYLDLASKNENSKFKIRNINLEISDLMLYIFDENIKKDFFVKSEKFRVSSCEYKKPILIIANGKIASSSHKISDFDLKLSVKTNPNSVGKFKEKLIKLNYNPLYYADFYKFYSKTDVDLKINPLDKKSNILGYIFFDKYTLEVNKFKLPENKLFLNFKNNKIYSDCDFKFFKNQQIKINSTLNIAKNKFIEAKLSSNELNLADLKEIGETLAKIFNLKFSFNDFIVSGFLNADVYLKSNFKTITSSGKLLIKNAKLHHKKTNLTVKNINSDVSFANNMINIFSTAYIDEAKFNIKGTVDNKTNLNLKVESDTLDIAQVLTLAKELPFLSMFVPKLKEYDFKKGYLKINTNILGNFEKPIIKSNSTLNNLLIKIKKYNLDVFVSKFDLKFLENDIQIPKMQIEVNSIPVFVEGLVKNYKTKQSEINLKIDSKLPKAYVLLNNSPLNLKAQIDIKQDKLIVNSCNVSNAFYVVGKVLNISSDPIFDLRANLENKALISFDTYKDIQFEIAGNASLLGDFKSPNLSAKFNMYNIKTPISVLKISDSIVNLDNNAITFLSPIVSYDGISFENVLFNGFIQNGELNVSQLKTKTLNGEIVANGSYDFKNDIIKTNAILKELNIRLLPNKIKELLVATSGKLSAFANLEFKSVNFIDSLSGNLKFDIINGELAQFAKLERFLQAGNILSQSFLKLSLNSALSTLSKQNTGDFKEIKGEVSFKNSIAQILYVDSQGSNMSFNMSGDYSLLSNRADLKILGRIPKSTVNVLGNIGKFSFGEQVEKSGGEVSKTMIEKKLSAYLSQEEIEKIPQLAYYDSSIGTREFVVLINGVIDNLNSIQDFKWVINE